MHNNFVGHRISLIHVAAFPHDTRRYAVRMRTTYGGISRMRATIRDVHLSLSVWTCWSEMGKSDCPQFHMRSVIDKNVGGSFRLGLPCVAPRR